MPPRASGSFFLALALVLIREEYAFPGWWALLPTLGTALLIGAGPTAAINKRLLSNRYLVYVGLISYPLYLWHWPLLTFARIVEDGIPPASVRIAALLASFLLADMTYRFVERPIRKRASTGARRWTVPGLSAAMAAGCRVCAAGGRWARVVCVRFHSACGGRVGRHLGLGFRRQHDHPRR